MKLAVEIFEALIGALVIGVVVLMGAAMLIHVLFERQPEYRADLTVPPHYIICQQDAGGNCWVKAH